MWCITGVPGSGKSTICKLLDESGIPCINALEIEGAGECVENGEVDLDCLTFIVDRRNSRKAVESHFSHLLNCKDVILIERSEDGVKRELQNRGYEKLKVDENLDALRSGTIYSESLEKLPSVRIHRLKVEEGQLNQAFDKCRQLILETKNKD